MGRKNAAMRATEFERRHPTVVRHSLIVAAIATYFFDPDDIVWRFIKEFPNRRELEHALFLVATLLIGVGATMCTRASALGGRTRLGLAIDPVQRGLNHQELPGEFLYAVGFASLLPLWGFVLLVFGEGVRILRLMRSAKDQSLQAPAEESATNLQNAEWSKAFGQQAAKWGIFASMIVFTITLKDRLIEILACASAIVWAMLNLPTRQKS